MSRSSSAGSARPIVQPIASTTPATCSGRTCRATDRLELQQRGIGGVAVEDPRVALRGLAERPVRDALAVREASTQEEVRAGSCDTNSVRRRVLPTPACP